METIEEQYLNLLKEARDSGCHKGDRTGTGTRTLFHRTLRHDMSEGFPILTTKKIAWKTLKVELEGFIKGITDKNWYNDNGCKIWNEFSYVDGRSLLHGDESRKLYQLNSSDCGSFYGHQWRSFDGKKTYNPPFGNIPFWVMKPSIDGKVYNSNRYGDFIILDKKSTKDVTIQFIHNGYIKSGNSMSNINRGMVKNPYHPFFDGVGCLGMARVKYPALAKQLFATWERMINRCYDTKSKDYENYGGRGVYVSNDWLVYEYFLEDVVLLDNWDLKVGEWDEYTLDKDVKGMYYYSKESCIWANRATQSENTTKSIEFVAVHESGKKYHGKSLNSFCEKYSVDCGDASRYINGKSVWKPSGWHITKVEVTKPSVESIDQLSDIIHTLKTNPNDRRMVCSAWNPKELKNMALPPCHLMFIITVTDGKLNLAWIQRSADIFLGVPFNLASYAVLLHLLAKETGFECGELTGTLIDAHVYENHIDAINEQLTRTPSNLPIVSTPEFNSVLDWCHGDTILTNYEPQSSIPAIVAV
jgi:thymidylate synthase